MCKVKTPQSKFFEALTAAVEPLGLELVVDYSYSNCGTIHVQREDSFESMLALPFSFQSGDYNTFGWQVSRHNGVEVGTHIFPGRSNPRFSIFSPSELGEVIDAIVAYVSKDRVAA